MVAPGIMSPEDDSVALLPVRSKARKTGTVHTMDVKLEPHGEFEGDPNSPAKTVTVRQNTPAISGS